MKMFSVILACLLPIAFAQDRLMMDTSSFSWSNCGGKKDTIVIDSLSISPAPLVAPGPVNISASATIGSNAVSPIKVKVDIEKKVAVIWVSVPCLDSNIGSCTYDNVCQNVSGLCPIAAGSYSTGNFQIQLPSIDNSLAAGQFKIQVNIEDGNGQKGCGLVYFKLNLA